MSKTIHITKRETIASLRKKIKESDDEMQKTRIRGIIRVKQGAKKKAVAEEFVVDRITVLNWVKAYNAGGTERLKMSRGGRPEGNPKWDTALFDALIIHIDTHPGYWSIPKMRVWLKKKYEKEIPDGTIWYHLKQRKYSYKSGRPHPYKGNRKAQAAFKKRDSGQA